ncbi:hypothetical protein [Aureispira anguillae]|uniref:Uncharacterized protein n=1 Tax=Aureispira anguillae TaxID=2864201 RepID=A0A915YBL9_9BACT|nr:hypothetical protein [Aureispira anguillae]BDS10097.1 hypothetical protein AsAng_0008040 [Aureispira anguillae]
MITIIPTIEKTTKIKVLALHVLLLSFSALLAQDYNEQLNQYFDLHHQQIELLQKQLHAAIMLCYTMGFLSLSTIGYFLFDYKIHAWLIDCSIWWNAKKNWLKNKWPF